MPILIMKLLKKDSGRKYAKEGKMKLYKGFNGNMRKKIKLWRARVER